MATIPGHYCGISADHKAPGNLEAKAEAQCDKCGLYLCRDHYILDKGETRCPYGCKK